MKYIIHTDGGSRGNPGNAAIGVVIEIAHDGTPAPHGTPSLSLVTAFGKTIGVTTNNVAEYTAVIEALKWILEKLDSSSATSQREDTHLSFYLDSTLVVNQLNGLFKVKDANMRMLMMKVRELEQQVGCRITYTYIPREQNSDADYQVNKALDSE